jgi:predicted transposase YbfD/YdcC
LYYKRVGEKINNLLLYFDELDDPRDNRGLKHELTNAIVMTIYGVLCGNYDAENIAFFLKLNEEHFEELLELEHGVPSADTLLRIYATIDPNKFMDIFSSWVKDIVSEKLGNNHDFNVIPIDGKAIRSATDKINNGNVPYVVSAFLNDLGISIGQVKVPDKANEITAIPDLIDLLDIKDCIITIDAIGTQTNIVDKIIEKEGHYCLSIKQNHKSIFEDINDYFQFALEDKEELATLKSFKENDFGHGRYERREVYVTDRVDFINDLHKWKNLTTIALVRSFREVNGKLSIKDKYYILDLHITPKDVYSITRNHWQIENNLHWILDVHFREDSSKIKSGHSISNLALIRKICYNLVKLDDSFGKISFKKKLMMYNHDLKNLNRLVFDTIPTKKII